MNVLPLVLGVALVGFGLYSIVTAVREPEGPAWHWLSFPGGRRYGGAATVMVGMLIVAGVGLYA